MVSIFPFNAKWEDQILIIITIKAKWPIMIKAK
jgi:hypothetical protein